MEAAVEPLGEVLEIGEDSVLPGVDIAHRHSQRLILRREPDPEQERTAHDGRCSVEQVAVAHLLRMDRISVNSA